MLTEKEKARYHRQMLIQNWGEDGQKRLKSACVFVAGAGGLGCPASLFLACAGIGRIRLCDSGVVQFSNLNRQFFYKEWEAGRNKALCAREFLEELNPEVTVDALTDTITEENALSLISGSDIIIDCLDNFNTRHILNRVAVEKSIPFIHAGIEAFSGQITFIQPPETPCLYCIYPGNIPRESIFPITGQVSGTIGTLEALEAVKWITGIGEPLKSRLLVWDGFDMAFQSIQINRDMTCPVCSNR